MLLAESDLAAIIADLACRAATFEERVAAVDYVRLPTPDAEMAAIAAQAGTSPQLLTLRGPPAVLLARVGLRDPAHLPGWAAGLRALWASLEPDAPPLAVPGGDPAFAAWIAPWLAPAGRWLDGALAAAPAALAGPARAGLLAWLARAWEHLARPVLPVGSSTPAPGELLVQYPGVARLFAEYYALWQRTCALVPHRLAADWAALVGAGAPAIESIDLLTLKRPPGGAPPLLVGLPGGVRVVYKSKDLRIAAWFARLLGELAAEGLEPVIAPRLLLAHADYAWADYAELRPCAGAAEVERWYLRVGMYLRLFQAVRACDLHGRNVVSAGEHLMFIDVETLFAPVRRTETEIESAIHEALVRSPIDTGLLPFWVTGDAGRRAFNAGGLSRGGQVAMPYRHTPESPRAAAIPADGYPCHDLEPTVPVVDGVVQAAAAHVDRLLDGYRRMSAVLARSPRVAALIAGAAGHKVKFMWRSGVLYNLAADQSLRPQLLTDGRLRDAFLTRLLAGEAEGPARALQLSVLRALRNREGPLMHAQPDLDAVLLDDGTRIAGVFAGPALDRIELARAPADVARDEDAIRTAIAVEEEVASGRPSRPPATGPAPPAVTDALALAVELGDWIAGEGITRGGETMWLGLTCLPTAGVRRLGVLPPDLLSGNAGLAVVFAYLFARSGAERFAAAARAALGPVLRDVRGGVRVLTGQPRTRGTSRAVPPLWGAGVGLAGQLYALRACGALLAEPALRDDAAASLAALANVRIGAATPRDATRGAAGLVLVAAGGYPQAQRIPVIARLAAHLAAPALAGPTLYPGGPGMPELPDDATSVAWALGRLGDAAAPPLPAAASALIRLDADPAGYADEAARQLDGGGGSGGLLADLELALSARDRTGQPRFAAPAQRLAAELVAGHRRRGAWMPDTAVPDRYQLSAITGLAAIALALARLDAPELRCSPQLLY